MIILSQAGKSVVKDILMVSLVFAALTGAYLGFAVAERYRALTAAYLVQSQQIMEIIQQNRTPKVDGSEVK